MSDLFALKLTLNLPERVSVSGRYDGNLVKRVAQIRRKIDAWVSEEYARTGRYLKCVTPSGTIAIVDRATTSFHGCDAVLLVDDITSTEEVQRRLEAGEGKWILPKVRKPGAVTADDATAECDQITKSWLGNFKMVSEYYQGESLVREGLRPPQVNAVYAIKAHWSVSNQAGTLVLPTGAGKTDTMVALLVSESIRKLFVIVPSDALRHQVADKFLRLGVLPSLGCVNETVLTPAVGLLSKGLKTRAAIDAFVDECNVVVATVSALSGMEPELQAYLAGQFSHLFVDEAHHIGARTWRDFKSHFSRKLVVQFTATPFRNDGRRVDGKFVYVYPLRRAQQDRLFTSISYVPIHGIDALDADRKIVGKVAEQIAADTAAGFDHLVMARTSTVDRAIKLHELYCQYLPQYNPILIHSKMQPSQRADALNRLRRRESRIIICVDMLGEGFDLPDLKIAALHDKHRSEAVTLQFVGRFTRSRNDLGSATVIANITIDDLNENLKSLYAEDADWNHILSVIGHTKTERERRREDLFTGFADPPERFPLEAMEPRFNCVVYKTSCTEWTPDGASMVSGGSSTIIEGPIINAENRLVIFVTRDEERLRWTTVRATRNVQYNLVMAHWNAELGLLFINSSKLGDLHQDLAERLAGPGVERVRGEEIFRVLHGFRRLILMNLGLSETQRKPIRFSQFMGSDIGEQLDALSGNRTRTKTNLFGQGYVDIEDYDESGAVINLRAARESIGCSAKGKIWSYQSSNSFAEWIDWCNSLGRRIVNDSITPEVILKNIVRPKSISEIPSDKVPIAVEWPEQFLLDVEDRIFIQTDGGDEVAFFNCDIVIADFSPSDSVSFSVICGGKSSSFVIRVSAGVVIYEQTGGAAPMVRRGKRVTPLLDVFKEDPPHVYFADGDLLVANELFELSRDETFRPYDPDNIEAADWSGTDISKESQGVAKAPDSIQRKIIERLLADPVPYDVVFDDDGPGEVADVVAIRRQGRTLQVDLFHCKYSSAATPGARIADLYEVCGQAQKSIRWAEHYHEMLHHLRRREGERYSLNGASRFEKGSMSNLLSLIGQWRQLHAKFTVTIVQPGYARSKAVRPHLELLAATESYLMETWRIPLKVIASA